MTQIGLDEEKGEMVGGYVKGGDLGRLGREEVNMIKTQGIKLLKINNLKKSLPFGKGVKLEGGLDWGKAQCRCLS